jgi:hypothetical protein
MARYKNLCRISPPGTRSTRSRTTGISRHWCFPAPIRWDEGYPKTLSPHAAVVSQTVARSHCTVGSPACSLSSALLACFSPRTRPVASLRLSHARDCALYAYIPDHPRCHPAMKNAAPSGNGSGLPQLVGAITYFIQIALTLAVKAQGVLLGTRIWICFVPTAICDYRSKISHQLMSVIAKRLF